MRRRHASAREDAGRRSSTKPREDRQRGPGARGMAGPERMPAERDAGACRPRCCRCLTTMAGTGVPTCVDGGGRARIRRRRGDICFTPMATAWSRPKERAGRAATRNVVIEGSHAQLVSSARRDQGVPGAARQRAGEHRRRTGDGAAAGRAAGRPRGRRCPEVITSVELIEAAPARSVRVTLVYPLTVSVLHSHLRQADYPVAIGHYRDDTIVSAEAALDVALGGRLEPPAGSRRLRRRRRSGGDSQRAGSAPARRDRDRPRRGRRSDAGKAGAARRQRRGSSCGPRRRRVERRRLGLCRDEHPVHRHRQRLDDGCRLDPLHCPRRARGQPQAARDETLGARAHRPPAVRRAVRGRRRAGRARRQRAARHARAGAHPRGRRQGDTAARRHARRRILAPAGGPSRAGLVAARAGLRQDVSAARRRSRQRRDHRARLHAAHGSREAVTEHGRPVPPAGRAPRRSVDAPVDGRSEAVERAVRAAAAGQPEALDSQRWRRPAAAQFRRGALPVRADGGSGEHGRARSTDQEVRHPAPARAAGSSRGRSTSRRAATSW